MVFITEMGRELGQALRRPVVKAMFRKFMCSLLSGNRKWERVLPLLDLAFPASFWATFSSLSCFLTSGMTVDHYLLSVYPSESPSPTHLKATFQCKEGEKAA